MSPLTLILFLVGVALLVGGAEILVRGASRLAVALGVSPLAVGLTVVAFGTSAPELAVGLQGAFTGHADVAVGNVVGSNIMNVLFVLGLSALITPMAVHVRLVRVEVPIMIACSVVVLVLSLDGRLGQLEGALLFVACITYVILTFRSRGLAPPEEETLAREESSLPRHILFVVVGLGLLILGSRWLVAGAVELATALGLSELVIGLTVVAVGTSLPEVATSVIAAIRGERDMAVGNVIGSNIFNLLFILGATSLVTPGGVAVSPAAVAFDMPVMIAVAVACLPILFTGHVIDRWEGLVFLLYYAAYTIYLILQATQHDALQSFGSAMLTFVVPITALTLGVVYWHGHRRKKT